MMLEFCALAGLLLTPAFGLPAQSEDPVDGLLRRLHSDDISEREEAVSRLRRLGKSIQGRLEQEIQHTQSMEVRARLQQLAGSLDIPPGGGQLSNGLKIVLATDKKVVRMNEPVTLTATLWNTTASPMKVFVGLSNNGVSLVNGTAYRVTTPSTQETPDLRWLPYCGVDGWGPIYAVIPPYGSKEFKSTLVLAVREGEAKYLLGGTDRVSVPDPGGTTHRIRAVLTPWDGRPPMSPRPISPGPARSADSIPLDRSAPDWSGRAESNGVDVQVER